MKRLNSVSWPAFVASVFLLIWIRRPCLTPLLPCCLGSSRLNLLGLMSILQGDPPHPSSRPATMEPQRYKSGNFGLFHRPFEANATADPLSVARPSPQTIAHHLKYQSWASEDAASYRSSLGRAQRGGWRRANLTCSPLTERGGDSWHRGGGASRAEGIYVCLLLPHVGEIYYY